MIALDAATGEVEWQSRYSVRYRASPPTRAHGAGPKATPLFHNGSLYTVGITGIVTAFEASNGKLL